LHQGCQWTLLLLTCCRWKNCRWHAIECPKVGFNCKMSYSLSAHINDILLHT
jgi:hypothetical protein